jgi:uncharacterized protein (TIGR02996 family)
MMTDLEMRPLLLAVCADPTDDAPRLILADFLDERGECDRAEVIRTQVAGARGSATANSLKRCDGLIEANWAAWTYPLLNMGRHFGQPGPFWFRRGFLQTVWLPPARFLKDAKTIFRYHPILNVRLMPDKLVSCSTRVLYDASMTSRGGRRRVPGPIFPYLADVGHPCVIHGAEARFETVGPFHFGIDAGSAVSRAAVNYGRHEAGLPPYRWKPLDDFPTEKRERLDDDDGDEPAAGEQLT